MKSVSLLALLFIGLFYAPLRKINWSSQRKLATSDYRIIDPRKSQSLYGAETYHKIKVDYSFDDSVLDYEVVTYFVPDSSWMKLYTGRQLTASEAAINTCQHTRGLQHEQGHFDLSEVYARKIRRTFQNFRLHKNEDSLTASIRQLLSRMTRAEKQYDAATLHSQDSLAQAAWSNNIDLMLDTLKSCENTKGSVLLK